MKYIRELTEGNHIKGVYLCKQKVSTETKAGKPYESIILMDKTGTIDGKIWDPYNPGIREYEAGDFIEVYGDVITFNNSKQAKITNVRRAEDTEYDLADYMPMTGKDIDSMYSQLLGYIDSVNNKYYKALLKAFFVEDEAFIKAFKSSSAAKTVHHGFIGGLLEHTLGVTNLCNYYCTQYAALNRDLLITAAICHDIGKIKELSAFPENDYTDEGQLLGHIVMGVEWVGEKAAIIDGFPVKQKHELQHCIVAHHGEFEFGSPKKPALIEAIALNFADNTDAKIETLTELFAGTENNEWLGFNKFLDSNIRKTSKSE